MNFQTLCEKICYQFRHQELLHQALTHKSYANENEAVQDNERFEFLGDAVLDLVISDILMERFPDATEGWLSKVRATLVNETGLARIANSIALGEYLLIGKGEMLTGGRQKNSILANTLEALFAAIYLDSRQISGLAEIHEVVRRLFDHAIPQAAASFFSHDFKTELQEYVQKRFHTISTYRLVRQSGPDHQKEFEVVVLVSDQEYGRGVGLSKKQAEQIAAKEALAHFHTLFPTET